MSVLQVASVVTHLGKVHIVQRLLHQVHPASPRGATNPFLVVILVRIFVSIFVGCDHLAGSSEEEHSALSITRFHPPEHLCAAPRPFQSIVPLFRARSWTPRAAADLGLGEARRLNIDGTGVADGERVVGANDIGEKV